jgi:DnaJ-class molecular chaperone
MRIWIEGTYQNGNQYLMTSHPSHDHDYYQRLGLSPNATPAEIVDAYRRMALRHHPDVSADDDVSSEMFKRITEAYGVLSDSQQRRRYDQRRTPPRNNRSPIYGDSYSDFARHSENAADAEFAVSPEEARDGGLFALVVTIHSPCACCAGCDAPADRICSGCNGTGRISHRYRATVALPAGLRDGSVIRPARKHAGDLILRIRIRPNV